MHLTAKRSKLQYVWRTVCYVRLSVNELYKLAAKLNCDAVSNCLNTFMVISSVGHGTVSRSPYDRSSHVSLKE